MGVEENKAIIRRFVESVLNEGRIEATGDFFHEDVVELDPLPGQGPGLRGLQEVLSMLRAAFPDLHWNTEEQIGEVDKVLSRFCWTGTHRGPYLGIAATGRPVRVTGMVIDRLVAGKIRESRILMDTLGMLEQMGVAAPPGGQTGGQTN